MINQTKDYDMFKKHLSNRDLVEGNIVKIMKSISMRNLLEFRPISVDPQMKIIDGQHRLEAARRLGVPIFYQVQESSVVEDILLLNANQKVWTMNDYLNYYTSNNNDNYLKLKRFMDRSGLTLQSVLILMENFSSGKANEKFKSGNFKFPESDIKDLQTKIDHINDVREYLITKMVGNRAFLKGPTFVRALGVLFQAKAFQFDVFMKKLEYKLDLIHPCSKVADYLSILKEIYNWHNRNPLGMD